MKIKKKVNVDKKVSGVYVVKVNGIVRYVGSSLQIPKRKSNHLGLLRHKKHSSKELQELYDKFGEDSFKFETVLGTPFLVEEEELYNMEKSIMDLHKDTIVNYSKVVQYKKHIRTKEEKEVVRRKLSEIMSGEGNPNCRLSEKEAKEIIELKKARVRHKDIANKFGVSPFYISKIGVSRWVNLQC